MDEMDWDPTSPRRLQPPQQSACPALRGMAHNQAFPNSPHAYYDSVHTSPSSSWNSPHWNTGSYGHHRSASSSDPFQATPHVPHASRLPFGYQGPHDPQVNFLHGGFGPSGFGYPRPAQQYAGGPLSSPNHPFQMDLPFGAAPMGPGSNHAQHTYPSGAPTPARDQNQRRSLNDRPDFSGGFAGRRSSSSPQRRGAPAFYSPPRAPESNLTGTPTAATNQSSSTLIPAQTPRRTPHSRRQRPIVPRAATMTTSMEPTDSPPLGVSRRHHWPDDLEDMRSVQILRGSVSTKMVASPAAIRSLQSVPLSELAANAKTCVICYNDFGAETPEGIKEAPVRLPNCKHVFGDHCIKKWFEESDSCPYCRDKLDSEPRITPRHHHVATGFRNFMRANQITNRLAMHPEVVNAYLMDRSIAEMGGSTSQGGERRSPPMDGDEMSRRQRPRRGSGGLRYQRQYQEQHNLPQGPISLFASRNVPPPPGLTSAHRRSATPPTPSLSVAESSQVMPYNGPLDSHSVQSTTSGRGDPLGSREPEPGPFGLILSSNIGQDWGHGQRRG